MSGLCDTEPSRFLKMWFRNTPVSEIKTGNLKQFLKWSLFHSDDNAPLLKQEEAELQYHVVKIQQVCNITVVKGYNPNILPMRTSLDAFQSEHRPFAYYMVRQYSITSFF